jgi:hypothetical protein
MYTGLATLPNLCMWKYASRGQQATYKAQQDPVPETKKKAFAIHTEFGSASLVNPFMISVQSAEQLHANSHFIRISVCLLISSLVRR